MGYAIILDVCIVLTWLCSAEAAGKTERFRRLSGDRKLGGSYLHLPGVLHFRSPLVSSEYFSPTRGTGSEPLPSPIRDFLLPAAPTPEPSAAAPEPRGADTRCIGDKMHVWVQKSVLGSGASAAHLSLGTCPPTGCSGDFIYFKIALNQCQTVRTMINNQMVYFNTLRYDPPESPEPIRRAVPFTLPVSCHYDRYQYLYKIGYIPKVETREVFKRMIGPADVTLGTRNAKWERLQPGEHYVLGQPMFFEVEARSLAPDRLLYAQECHATLEPEPSSTPRLAIIDNFGCMVQQAGRAQFFTSRYNQVRFAVDAFLFKAPGQRMYMHCTVSTAGSTATPTAKACNYDSASASWKEVSGLDSVCSCCETSCSSVPSSDAAVVSSRSWTVEPKVNPPTSLKRRIIMTTSTTMMTPTTIRIMTKLKTSQQETTTVSPVEVDAPEEPVTDLKGSGIDHKVLKGSGRVKEILKISGGVNEIVREILNGSEGEEDEEEMDLHGSSRAGDVLKDSVDDGNITKGPGGVEDVPEGSGGVEKHEKGIAVEPHRIFEHFFGLD